MQKKRKRRAGRAMNSSLLEHSVFPALITALVVALLYGILLLLNSDLLKSNSSIILFTAFGASAFLLLTAPHSTTSKVSRFVKSYVIATILGPAGYLIALYVPLFVSIGIIIFIMTVLLYATQSEHPPSIGIAIAFIIYRIDIYGVLIVVIGIIMLASIRILTRKYLYRVDSDIEHESELA